MLTKVPVSTSKGDSRHANTKTGDGQERYSTEVIANDMITEQSPMVTVTTMVRYR
jgi:hypothetical protein